MKLEWKKWKKAGDPHLMNRIQWDEKETSIIEKVFEDDWFGRGRFHKDLEESLKKFTSVNYFHLVNSGSSALYLALKTLRDKGILKRGDKLLHPISTFATSASSIILNGLVPVYVETKKDTYVIDPEEISRALKIYPDIKGAVIPHILGNVPDMKRIKELLGERILIEDSCDTMGGEFDGKPVGSFGDFVAFSFYGSHHITGAGGGGALGTNNLELYELAESNIYWGRDFSKGDSFLKRYKYLTCGTNSQLPAVNAAFAFSQMKKLKGFVEEREKQFKEIYDLLSEFEEFIRLPKVHPLAKPSWFSFPIVIKENAPFTVKDFVDYLALPKNNVEIRPIMCGNILRERVFAKAPHIIISKRHPIGDEIKERGLFIPSWGMPKKQKDHYHKVLRTFFEKYI